MILGRWQAQKTARMYLNESRAILAELHLEPLEKTLAPFRCFFLNATPRNFETLEPLPSNRQSSKRGLGGRGRRTQTFKKPAKNGRKTNAGVPRGPARVWGVARLAGGGRLSGNAPFSVLLTKKGGGTTFRLGSFVCSVPNFY